MTIARTATPPQPQPASGAGRPRPPAAPGLAEPAWSCPVCGSAQQPPRAGAAAAAGRSPDRVMLLLDWLARNQQTPGLRLGDLAAAADLSPRRLQAVCKARFGCTPMRLLADIRMHHARTALTSPGPTVALSQAARIAGISRISRFRAAYRARYGTDPSSPRDRQPGTPGTPAGPATADPATLTPRPQPGTEGRGPQVRPAPGEAAVISSYAAGLSLRGCAAAHNLTVSQVRGMLTRHAIPARPPGRHRQSPAVEQAVITAYTTGQLAMHKCARMFGIHPETVRAILDRHHIPRRSRAESIRLGKQQARAKK